MGDGRSDGAIELVARAGYAARGFLYLIVGALALLVALGRRQVEADTGTALQELLNQPFGQILLAAIAAGLLGFAVWRLVAALFDADNRGRSLKGLALRGGFLVSAGLHVSLALAAMAPLLGGTAGHGGDYQAQDWTARLMGLPFGQWLVGAAGTGFVTAGLYFGYKAAAAKFRKRLTADADRHRWVVPVCRFGIAARGVTFILIGGFVLLAALHFNPAEARGLGGALEALRLQPWGPVLLGIVALGLAAFGVYGIVEALWRRIGDGEIRKPAR